VGLSVEGVAQLGQRTPLFLEIVGFPILLLIMFLLEKPRSPHPRYNLKMSEVVTYIKLWLQGKKRPVLA
jgi:hypothetical protein